MATRAARNGSLEGALAQLIQNQAAFVSLLPEIYSRFARIEADLEQIKAILLRHEQILSDLPGIIRRTIRREVGFKPQ